MIINNELMQNRKRIRTMQQNRKAVNKNHALIIILLCKKFYKLLEK